MAVALLDAGFPVRRKNANQWSVLEDATALKDKEMVKLLHAREMASVKAQIKSKKGQVVQTLNQIPDCAFQVRFLLNSKGQVNMHYKNVQSCHTAIVSNKAIMRSISISGPFHCQRRVLLDILSVGWQP